MREDGAAGTGGSILVVDDAAANLQLLTNLLTEHGYVVYPASDGELALEFIRTTIPDLILMDIRMPGMDGYEVCRRLKANEATRSIPVIFISILEDEREKVRGFQEGGVDYITKPFQPEEVLARIRTQLRLRELTVHLEQTIAARTAELQSTNARLQIELAERARAEEDVLHERLFLSQIMETSPVGITMVDTEGLVTFANSQAESLLGLSKTEITGRSYNAPQWRITDFDGGPFPDDRLPFSQVMATRNPVFDVRHAIEWPDGRRQLLSINGAPLFGEDGKIESVVFAMQDITEWKRMEESLRQSEERFRRLAENAPDMIYRMSLPDGKYEFVSLAAQSIIGYAPQEFYDNDLLIRQIIHPDWQSYFQEQWKDLLEGKSPPTYEYQCVHKSGEIRWVNQRNILLCDENGHPAAIEGIVTDITERKRIEVELQKSSDLLRAIIEAAPVAIMGLDLEGKVHTVWNPAAEKMLGWSAREAIGQYLPSVPVDKEEEFRRFREWIRSGKSLDGVEVSRRRRDGTPIDYSIYASPLFGPGGEITGNVAVLLDITERKRAEGERLAHLHFLEAMDRINMAIVGAKDLEQMMTDVLDLVLSIFDCDRAFLLYPCDPGASVWTVTMESTKPEYPGVLAMGVEVPMTPPVADTLRTLLDAEGAVKFGPGTSHPLPDDAAERFGFRSLLSMALRPRIGRAWQFGLHQCSHGRIWTVEEERLFIEIGRRLADGLSTLITHRELRESEAKFSSAFHSSPAALSVSGLRDPRFLDVNDSFLQLTGYAREDVLGHSSFELNLWVDPEQGRDFRRLFQEHGHVRNFEYTYRRKDGSVGYGLASAALITVGGEACILAQTNDITERKQAEEEIVRYREHLEELVHERTAALETANRELEAFAYSVSHDLRAPLRHIDGFVSLLKKQVEPTLDEQGRHYMKKILDAARKMAELIDDLLSFSRMGRQAMSIKSMNLGDLAREVIQELESDVVGRSIEWRIGEIPGVKGDPSMLRIVMTNLISNAVKFTRPRERAVIEICSHLSEKDVVVTVRDNGVGFDPAHVDKLFGVFQRLHSVEEFEGTGAGLAIARRIILRHGGRIWAEGQVDGGAAFHFSLPQSGQDV